MAAFLAGATFTVFFFTATPTTEIYTLSLHDALPISENWRAIKRRRSFARGSASSAKERDRKSTRLNSSHQIISYAVFCLKKKNKSSQRRPPVWQHRR